MEGTQNDYVYIDALKKPVDLLPSEVMFLADRRRGVGGDGVILIASSATEDARMIMYNPDGTEAEMCGNALRCIGKYLFDRVGLEKESVTIETLGGVKEVTKVTRAGEEDLYQVNMGRPVLDPKLVPVDLPGDLILNHPFQIDGFQGRMTCVSMGNPHAVFFVPELSDELVLNIGKRIETHSLFPRRINVEFVTVEDRSSATMRVWERGTGETFSCGTGASAVLVAGVLLDLLDPVCRISLLGGTLEMEWQAPYSQSGTEEIGPVFKKGPAKIVFDGEVELREG